MKVKNGLSSSMEDYLREIYVLTQKNDEVRVTDIAQLLGISKPSVNRAMNTLKEQGYIEHEHYGTKAGAEAGKSVYDTYKIVYKFLTDVLEVRPSDAEEEAHLLEHDISKGTRKKLKKFMKKRK